MRALCRGLGFEAQFGRRRAASCDAIVPIAAFAAVTDRIDIGSGVINNWTRNIGLLPPPSLTLDDLAPDRIICGIGVGGIRWRRMWASTDASRSPPCATTIGSCRPGHGTRYLSRGVSQRRRIGLDVVHGRASRATCAP